MTPTAYVTPFRCPGCRTQLIVESDNGIGRCHSCGRAADHGDAILDLVTDERRDAERAFYEREYGALTAPAAKGNIADLEPYWRHPAKPVNRALVRRLENLSGRRLLLVGNGGQAQELFFLIQRPEFIVFSDLSSADVASVRDQFDLSRYEDRLWFAALDALELPLEDESIDVVYGNAIVHHLPDVTRFLAEVVRVLRPGGRAVFADAAYSPLWQRAKLSVLRPLLRYSHRRVPRSPEDVRDTMQGGFHEAEMARIIRGLGAQPWFERLSLAYYLWRRATLVLLPEHIARYAEHARIAGPLIRFDEQLGRRPRARRHLIRLVWGLNKPSCGRP